jgi:hypothetical protein
MAWDAPPPLRTTTTTSVSHQGIVIPDTFGHDTHAKLPPFPPRLSANDQRADGLQAFVSISIWSTAFDFAYCPFVISSFIFDVRSYLFRCALFNPRSKRD